MTPCDYYQHRFLQRILLCSGNQVWSILAPIRFLWLRGSTLCRCSEDTYVHGTRCYNLVWSVGDNHLRNVYEETCTLRNCLSQSARRGKCLPLRFTDRLYYLYMKCSIWSEFRNLDLTGRCRMQCCLDYRRYRYENFFSFLPVIFVFLHNRWFFSTS